MNNKRAIIPLLTPILGTMPIVVFFIFNVFASYHVALAASLVTYVGYFVLGVLLLKVRPPYTLLSSTAIFILFAGLMVTPLFRQIYTTHATIVFEILAVLVFFVFDRIKSYFKAKILVEETENVEFKLLAFDADTYVIRVGIFLITTHLLIVLLYLLYPTSYHTPAADTVIYSVVMLSFVALHFLYEFIHWNVVKKQLAHEVWLPIVDETGGVKGKVAHSVSHMAGNKYRHPVVRIALIHRGKIYLKDRPMEQFGGMEMLDYPFERILRFDESLEEGVKRTLSEHGAPADLPCRFVFRYVYKDDNTNRLIYLYTCSLHQAEELERVNLSDGKWWTGRQIDENLNNGLFSPYFEQEYEFLNSTVLMADRLMWDLEQSV